MAEQREVMPSPLPFLSHSAEVLAEDCRISFMVLLYHHNLGLTTCSLGTSKSCRRIPFLPSLYSTETHR